MQNGHVESFNGRMREECLNVSWFGNLFEAREKIAVWRKEYNEERPHSSLGVSDTGGVCSRNVRRKRLWKRHCVEK